MLFVCGLLMAKPLSGKNEAAAIVRPTERPGEASGSRGMKDMGKCGTAIEGRRTARSLERNTSPGDEGCWRRDDTNLSPDGNELLTHMRAQNQRAWWPSDDPAQGGSIVSISF